MLFADNDRYTYARSPLIETICQLRYPTILSIGPSTPTDFQRQLVVDFPQYGSKKEQQPPTVVNGKLTQTPPITNHNFISTDGLWKVNLTQNFISLSTLRYGHWEEFAQQLDKVLATFIQTYHPAFFERIGLRYINAFSKRQLGLEEELWDDLINAPFIGVLSEPDVDEAKISKCVLDMDMSLGNQRHIKLHAGPGMLGDGKKDPEIKFILDSDLSVFDQEIPAQRIAGDLEVLHDYAVRIFNAAITQELREAMGATPM